LQYLEALRDFDSRDDSIEQKFHAAKSANNVINEQNGKESFFAGKEASISTPLSMLQSS